MNAILREEPREQLDRESGCSAVGGPHRSSAAWRRSPSSASSRRATWPSRSSNTGDSSSRTGAVPAVFSPVRRARVRPLLAGLGLLLLGGVLGALLAGQMRTPPPRAGQDHTPDALGPRLGTVGLARRKDPGVRLGPGRPQPHLAARDERGLGGPADRGERHPASFLPRRIQRALPSGRGRAAHRVADPARRRPAAPAARERHRSRLVTGREPSRVPPSDRRGAKGRDAPRASTASRAARRASWLASRTASCTVWAGRRTAGGCRRRPGASSTTPRATPCSSSTPAPGPWRTPWTFRSASPWPPGTAPAGTSSWRYRPASSGTFPIRSGASSA